MNQDRASQSQQPIRLGVGGGGRLTGEAAQDTKGTIRKLLSYLGPYRVSLFFVSILVLIVTAANLYGPILIGRAIDDYVVPPWLADHAGVLGALALAQLQLVTDASASQDPRGR